jgi:5-methyltetrahydropteroyltriglutamate--homocysteine methyltransferase
MDYAAAVNEEIRDLFAAGADVVQLDDPYAQARPEKAKRYAIKALNRALEGVTGTTAVHICFGYAAIIHDRPSGYSFLPELTDATVQQVSIESAQSGLDLAVLRELGDKTVILGVLNLGDPRPETAEGVAAHIRRALQHIAPERLMLAPDCGMKYLQRESAYLKLKAMVDGAAIVRAELGG